MTNYFIFSLLFREMGMDRSRSLEKKRETKEKLTGEHWKSVQEIKD